MADGDHPFGIFRKARAVGSWSAATVDRVSLRAAVERSKVWQVLQAQHGGKIMDREQEQRERAYRIWEEEGRPADKHEEHWER
ncbi:MAG: DUF2934 domain-containing protein, partial [Allorhizobium sp.]